MKNKLPDIIIEKDKMDHLEIGADCPNFLLVMFFIVWGMSFISLIIKIIQTIIDL